MYRVKLIRSSQLQISRLPFRNARTFARCSAARMVQCSMQVPSAPKQSLSVAVIGAGAGGLVAARELVQEGHQVTVFEKGSQTGGVWVYTDDIESPDLLGKDPKRHKVHSSMYANLRTNLPREVMAYTDFPFDDLNGRSQDSRRFPSHAEVLRYLQAFASTFHLKQYVQFDTEVTSAVPVCAHTRNQTDQAQQQSAATNGTSDAEGDLPWPSWRLTTRSVAAPSPSSDGTSSNGPAMSNGHATSNGQQDTSDAASNGHNTEATNSVHDSQHEANSTQDGRETEGRAQNQTYDALVVCNGHYSAPRCPEVEGSEIFPGTVMHSHNYRVNEAFKGQVVVLVGASASGEDICREIAEVADKVYLCARSWQNPDWAKETKPFGSQHNIWRRPVPSKLSKDGAVTFSDGQRVQHVDTVMYCTGYLYTFPFLKGIVATTDNRVSPVYRHIFPLSTAPTLAIIGLPWKVVPFPEFELQAKWIARVLSKRVGLPSQQSMQADVGSFYSDLEQQGTPARYTHQLGDKQWAYKDWIAEQCGPDAPKTEEWRRLMYEATGNNKREFPDRYRDVWRDEHLLEAAQQDASQHSSPELRAG